MSESEKNSTRNKLRRDIGLPSAILLGLGSIVGTGVFVSIGVAAGVSGAGTLVAIFLASLVATCNGLSSAQLAAAHPVSGGTYEYGYRWLSPSLGFTAGWLFLFAKSASAATAALGLAGYLQQSGVISLGESSGYFGNVGIALLMLIAMTVIVLIGIKRTAMANSVIVSITLIVLAAFVFSGMGAAMENASENLADMFQFRGSSEKAGSAGLVNLLSATALMFVAYTGYGRIATMGEEVAEPRKTIPRAMIATLAITMVLYVSVGFVAIAVVGADGLNQFTGKWAAPLMGIVQSLNKPWLVSVLAVGAITAMLGVMLNLLLGLSRVALAMSRRSDLPVYFSGVTSSGVPLRSTLLVAVVIGSLVLIGDVRLSWSFSAMMVLMYYSLTNACAIRLDASDRLYPVWISWAGLISCVTLALFVEWQILIVGVAMVLVGIVARSLFRRIV